jgi:hypothetical protein
MSKKILYWLIIFMVILTIGHLIYCQTVASEGFQATQTTCGFYYVGAVKRWICPTQAALTALGTLKTGTDLAYVTACTAVPVGTITHWMCPPNPKDGSRNYTAELVDISGNSRVPFVGSDDRVCFTYDISGGVYYCKDRLSGNPYDDYTGTLAMDKDTTCSNLQKALIDISGNISDLTKLQNNTNITLQTLKSARDSLNEMYVTYKCATVTGANAVICEIIKSGATSIGGNFTDIDTLYSKTTDPGTKLIKIKETIVASIKEFRC